MVDGVIAKSEGAKVSGKELEQKWAAREVTGPKTLAGYSLFIPKRVIDANRVCTK